MDVTVRPWFAFRKISSLLFLIIIQTSCTKQNTQTPSDDAYSSPKSETVQAVLPSEIVEVVEYYHAAFDHYFVTAMPEEIAALDSGRFTGWQRTGYRFNVVAPGAALTQTSPVCRFYGRPEAGLDSHFYSASPDECQQVKDRFSASWQFESDEVFRAILPNLSTGACPSGSRPIYRLWNQRADSNHRYTTDRTVFDQMVERGYVAEGYGTSSLPVVMCSPEGSPGASGPIKLSCEEARFLKLINLYRAQFGIAPLVASSKATLAARWHSNDMGVNRYFSHTDSLGRDPYERTAQFGFGYCQGENAAAGNYGATETFCQWKLSPGHAGNMQGGHFRSIGIGRAIVGGSEYGVYWSTPFGVGYDATDKIEEPVTDEPGCVMPTSLPGC